MNHRDGDLILPTMHYHYALCAVSVYFLMSSSRSTRDSVLLYAVQQNCLKGSCK
jgi:hypothetical protein